MEYSKEAIRERLILIGCGEKQIQDVQKALEEGNMRRALVVLEKRRTTLLEEYHACGQSIDSVDYLIYRLKNVTNLDNHL